MSMDRRDFLKVAAGSGAVVAGLGLAACSGNDAGSGSTAGSAAAPASDYKVTMVTDMGGVNDQSFNQSAWEGLQQLKDDYGIEVSYTESKQESDYATNLDRAVDAGNNLVWGIGFAMAEAIMTAAQQNSDVSFAIVDNSWADDEYPDNLTGVMFRAQEPSFLVGYIAARTTKTGKVGFVGGIGSNIIDQFEWGYKAGVAYANAEKGTKVTVDTQYLESFTDAALGKATAQRMYTDGCDIVFHAAGNAGNGVIEAAGDADKLVIGVDQDQAHLDPDHVLTSAMKNVNNAVEEISKQAADGENIGGQTIELGMTDDAVGIPKDNPLMDKDVYDAAIALEDQIKSGDIVPPATEDDYKTYAASL